VDGGLEELGPLETAVALVEIPPGIECTGNGDGDGTEGRERAVFGACTCGLEREALGGAAGAGEGHYFGLLGVPHEDVAVSADAGADGFKEAEAGVGGYGSVGGGASALKDVNGGHCGEGVCGAGGSVAAVDGGACGEAGSVDTVTRVDVGAEEALGALRLKFWESVFGACGAVVIVLRHGDSSGSGQGKCSDEGTTTHGISSKSGVSG